jgi:prepilin signal peptidase PulO-like enzyme (type II secretory pathway)
MYIAIIFTFGLIIGSFLNALIWRLHSGESMNDRSRCTRCHQVIAWHDNIPVISYLLLRGKCRKCGEGISVQYPLVELVTAILFVIVSNNFQFSIFNFQGWNSLILMLRSWFIISVMIVVFIYDLRWYLILDKVTMPASMILFSLWLFENWQVGNLLKIENWSLIITATVVGSGFFGLQYILSKGRWIGLGDVKLGLVMGLALGWPNIIGGIFLAYMLGAVIGVGLILGGKKELGSKVPFGTFLSVATVIMLLWGGPIVNWYLNMTGF